MGAQGAALKPAKGPSPFGSLLRNLVVERQLSPALRTQKDFRPLVKADVEELKYKSISRIWKKYVENSNI